MKKIIRYFSILIGLTASFTSLAKEKISLMLDWYVNPDHAAIIVAQQKGFFEKNNICRFQPFSGHFLRKTPAPRASSEADLVIPQVRSGAESAFSLNFIRHQCPAPNCSM